MCAEGELGKAGSSHGLDGGAFEARQALELGECLAELVGRGQAEFHASGVTLMTEAEALEHLRMLSNINSDKYQILQIILVGQPQLRDLLLAPQLRQFAQRISSDFHLRPLSIEDVANYIAFRLRAVGATRPLFTPEACDTIGAASGGIPRMINILCDTALVYGFAAGKQTIGVELVREVIADKQQYSIFPVAIAVATS